MTSEQRERAIHACGQLMQAAMERYERTYNGDDREEALRYQAEMRDLIAGRTPGQVQAMELARGLV